MREINRIVAIEEKNQAMIQQLMQIIEQQEEKLQQQNILTQAQAKQLEELMKSVNQKENNFYELLNKKENKQVMLLKNLQEKQQCSLNRMEQLKNNNQILNKEVAQLEKFIVKQMPQPTLEYFVLNILDHCNLRCKGCDHFAAIAEERFVTVDNIEKDLSRMSDLLDQQAVRIGIMGGEPLLHPDLLLILSMTRKYFPNTIIQLVTNGLLLMQQTDEFWKTCKENNIVIVNTKYPINLDYDGMVTKAEQFGVAFEHYGNTGEKTKTSYKIPLDLKGKQNPRSNYLKCHHSNNCSLLMEGKFYACTVAPNINIFNKRYGTDLKLVEDDYLDIYKINDKQEIFDFLSKPIPFCRYCDVEHRQYGLEWERSKQLKEEWIVE